MLSSQLPFSSSDHQKFDTKERKTLHHDNRGMEDFFPRLSGTRLVLWYRWANNWLFRWGLKDAMH